MPVADRAVQGLTAEEIEAFRRDGFAVIRGVLQEADLRPLEQDYTRLIDAKARALLAAGHIRSLHEGESFSYRLAAIAEECSEEVLNKDLGPWALQLDTMYALQEGCFRLFFSPRLLACVESIVGPEITLSPIQHFRPFLPTRGGRHVPAGAATLAPWHQDQGVTREEADASEILTCFAALADIPAEAGCLQVLRPHSGPLRALLEHVKDPTYGTTIRPDELPPARAVDVPLRRGDVLLFNSFVVHRTARVNSTRDVRWSLDMRFQRTGTPTGRHFWPEFVVRSRADPASEQRSVGDWRRRWTRCLAASKGERWHRVSGDVGGSIGGQQLGATSLSADRQRPQHHDGVKGGVAAPRL